MKETEVASFIISVCRPGKRRKSPYGSAMVILGGVKPHRETTMDGRMSEARRQLRDDIHFLAGMMSILPALRLKRGTQFWNEGEKLLNAAHKFANKCASSTSSVRRMRVFGERMSTLLDKIEKDAGIGAE